MRPYLDLILPPVRGAIRGMLNPAELRRVALLATFAGGSAFLGTFAAHAAEIFTPTIAGLVGALLTAALTSWKHLGDGVQAPPPKP